MEQQQIMDLVPVVKTVDVASARYEVAVPRLYFGRRPEVGVGDPFYGVWSVVYEAEGPQLLDDAELVFCRDRQTNIGAEVRFEPGPQPGRHDLRVVVGHEVYPDVEIL